MANVGSIGIFKHIDDPSVTVIATDTVATGTAWVTTTDGGTVLGRAVAAGRGVHYAGATNSSSGSMTEFVGNNTIFTGQEGHSAVEILVQLTEIDSMALNFGFNDEVLETGGSSSLPMEISSAAITANSASFIGFVYDTDADNDELHCLWVDDGVVGMSDADSSVDGKPVRMKGMAPTSSKWLYLKVEMQDMGSGKGVRATFLAVDHLGRSMEKVFNTSVDRDVQMCYYLAIESRGSANSIYLRNCNFEQTIADM